jgi:4-hydroxy-tetrahydrodipicolinate reductase
MIKIGVFGSSGKMGSLVIDDTLIDKTISLGSVHVFGELNKKLPSTTIITENLKEFIDSCDVVIDFSIPKATGNLLEYVIENKNIPLVIATTGLSNHHQNLIATASKKMPILYATNMSLGVALLNKLVDMSSRILKNYDCEIIEYHHRHKIDSPSGTALTLAKSASDARDLELNNIRVSGRDGNIGSRTKDEIGVMALRGGDIAGRHTVGFYGDGEFIELNHTATSKNTFSKGSIRAAKWLVNQENGLYSINDCLEI